MSDTTAVEDTVTFPFQGKEYAVPVRLIELQRTWDRADAECARLQRETDAASQAAYERARQERERVALAKQDEPWLTTAAGAFSHAQDAVLRAAARAV